MRLKGLNFGEIERVSESESDMKSQKGHNVERRGKKRTHKIKVRARQKMLENWFRIM